MVYYSDLSLNYLSLPLTQYRRALQISFIFQGSNFTSYKDSRTGSCRSLSIQQGFLKGRRLNTMPRIKVSSLNVNGIGNAIKRRVIFNVLREQKADIYLIQETHSTPESGFLWAREWGGQAFFSHGLSGSRGVAILIDRKFDIQVLATVRDTEGRFIGMDIRSGNQTFTVCSYYSPTQDKPREQ